MPLVAFCLRHFSADFIICTCEFDFRQAQRYLGEIDNSPDAVRKLVAKLRRQYERLHFCYEAGPTGYGLHRQLAELGRVCDVVATTMIPKRPGDRVKTNRRDSVTLVKLLRAGELRAIWVPDSIHEAVRDLTRARPVGRNMCEA
jgi:transposase